MVWFPVYFRCVRHFLANFSGMVCCSRADYRFSTAHHEGWCCWERRGKMNKGHLALVVAFLGVLVWAFLDRSAALDEAYDAELEIVPDRGFWESSNDAGPRGYRDMPLDSLGDPDLDLVEVHIESIEYVVAEGDSLWQLEKRFGVRFEAIYELNKFEIDRNYARRCGEPTGYSYASLGHCSTPEATLEQGMLLKIPTDIWIAPIQGYEM